MRADLSAPVFDQPWQADLFAVTVCLNEQGHFSWSEWTGWFGAGLARRGLEKQLNGGEDYFLVWLETLEVVLQRLDMASIDQLANVKNAWQNAYLATPHGAPVRLPDRK